MTLVILIFLLLVVVILGTMAFVYVYIAGASKSDKPSYPEVNTSANNCVSTWWHPTKEWPDLPESTNVPPEKNSSVYITPDYSLAISAWQTSITEPPLPTSAYASQGYEPNIVRHSLQEGKVFYDSKEDRLRIFHREFTIKHYVKAFPNRFTYLGEL